MKKLIVSTMAALYLALCPMQVQAASAKVSVEVMAGQDSATLDTKLVKPLDEGFALFNRNRVTVGYDGAENLDDAQVSSFHVFNLSYDIPGISDLRALVEVDLVPGVKVDPRIGAQYAHGWGDFSLFQAAHIGLNQISNPDFTSITNLGYNPRLTDNLSFVSNLENVLVVGEDGHKFSTQRLRLGFDIDGYQVGLAADLTEPANGIVGYNTGGFLKKDF